MNYAHCKIDYEYYTCSIDRYTIVQVYNHNHLNYGCIQNATTILILIQNKQNTNHVCVATES